jgi:histidine kinase
MSIRKKLLLSHTAIILIPCILFTIALFIIFYAFVGKEGMMNFSQYDEQVAMEDALYSELRLLTTSNPELLNNLNYLSDIDREASTLGLSLIMRIDSSLVYQSESLQQIPIEGHLTPFGSFKSYSHDSLNVDEHSFKYDQHDFYFPDQKKGSIFLIKETSNLEYFMVEFHPWLLLILLVTLVVTNGLISFYVSRNLITPLITLKDATNKIKNGDLDFEIKSERKDEIGELFSSFEEMRSQLNQSIDLQLKYEENRKLLLSNISHDLKTPITAIKGYVEGIQDGIANSPEKMDRYIQTIYKKANDMDAMIEEVFLFSKLDLKRVPFDFVTMDIVSYLKECVEEMSLEYEKDGIEITFSSPSTEATLVYGDPEKLMRVFTNIIGNSVKYKDKTEGQVQISLQQKRDWVEVIIEDNGPGIPTEAIPHVFEQFFRADQSRNSTKGGSGLGLAIAKQIIEEHQGHIWVNPGKKHGTEIHFTLKKLVE